MKSVLTKNQKKKFSAQTDGTGAAGKDETIICTVRYDDECGNGHNTFGMTVWAGGRNGWGGADTDSIKKYFPELAKYTKWHLMSSDGPMHYVANSLYHAERINKHKNFVYLNDKQFKIKQLLGLYSDLETQQIENKYNNIDLVEITSKIHPDGMNKEPDLEYARNSAIWPDAELSDFTKENLEARLPELIKEFKSDVEELGFIF